MKGSGSQTESYASRRSPRIPSEKLCCYVAWCQYNLQCTLYTARKHCFPPYNFDVDVRSSFPRCFIWSYSQNNPFLLVTISPGERYESWTIHFAKNFEKEAWFQRATSLESCSNINDVFMYTSNILWHLYVVFTLIKKILPKIARLWSFDLNKSTVSVTT